MKTLLIALSLSLISTSAFSMAGADYSKDAAKVKTMSNNSGRVDRVLLLEGTSAGITFVDDINTTYDNIGFKHNG
jgi:hypothetical protein